MLDFDGDGWPDIALSDGWHHEVRLILGRSDGWAPEQSRALPGEESWSAGRLAVGDLDGDGRDELMVALAGNRQLQLLRGRADGHGQQQPGSSPTRTPTAGWTS